jgi:hypothetical protein
MSSVLEGYFFGIALGKHQFDDHIKPFFFLPSHNSTAPEGSRI